MSTGDIFYNIHSYPTHKEGVGLIRLQDGSLVEVELPEYKRSSLEYSSYSATPVSSGLDKLRTALSRIAMPIAQAATEVGEKTKTEASVEVEIGMGFDAEGRVYITKDKVGSNLNVKFSFRTNHSGLQ